uniref:Uncharacterized protein n=1 Tax=Onchocerca volvulus TaxID=6282 RepID=A0A8R1XLV2_ONCVO
MLGWHFTTYIRACKHTQLIHRRKHAHVYYLYIGHRRGMKAVVEEEEDEEEADVHVDDACPGRQCMQCMHMFSVQGHSFPTPHQVATAPSTIIIHLSSSVYP